MDHHTHSRQKNEQPQCFVFDQQNDRKHGYHHQIQIQTTKVIITGKSRYCKDQEKYDQSPGRIPCLLFTRSIGIDPFKNKMQECQYTDAI